MASRTLTTDAHEQDTEKRLVGLTSREVAARHARGEGNAVSRGPSRSYRRILFENAITFVNVVLFAIVIFLLVLGLYGDALMTGVLVSANIVVGVFQEARAKRKLDKIAVVTRPVATVIRDGREQQIDPGQIVREDLLRVRAGDQILVDGAVVQSNAMAVDESLLTGESDLILKREGESVYSGSFCMTGAGVYRAEKVGVGSIAQQITEQARSYRDVKTPLQREIALAIRVMIVLMVILVVQVLDTFRHIYHHLPLTESVRAAAVIVALVPQGLVFMVTVTYAMAAVRMSGKGALIQRMNAVESTAAVSVLCVDKTGTLTTNQLRLHALQPVGIDDLELRGLLGDFASSASSGNRTSDAIREACGGRQRKVRGEVPFSSQRKWSAVAFNDGAYVLGAPEMLADAVPGVADLESQIADMTSQGYRVLLFAKHRDAGIFDNVGDHPRLVPGFVPLGLVTISDVLRPEAAATIAQFRESGITLKIISGDNPDTVAALARQAGVTGTIETISGPEIEHLSDEGLRAVVQTRTVFGRITPQQKERIISALRASRQYVAMVGDGVNDVLAMKQANLAVSMRSGSQVTRSVADVVLMDDSFAALPAAFREGQRILKGMQDIIRLFVIRALYVSLIILGTTVTRAEFPVTPKQNALLALITVGVPVVFLAAWARPAITPRRLITSSTAFVLPASLTIAATGLTVYLFILAMGGTVMEARTALTLLSVLCGLILIPFSSPPNEAWQGGEVVTGDWRPTLLAGGLLVFFVAALFFKPARDFYELAPLPFTAYVLIGLVAIGWATSLRFLWRLGLIEQLAARIASLRARMAHVPHGVAPATRTERPEYGDAPRD